MSTPKASVVDDVIPEFDFSRAIPSPFRDRARKGMRSHILTDDADLPILHVTAHRRGRARWIQVDELDGSGRPARWSTIESAGRDAIDDEPPERLEAARVTGVSQTH